MLWRLSSCISIALRIIALRVGTSDGIKSLLGPISSDILDFEDDLVGVAGDIFCVNLVQKIQLKLMLIKVLPISFDALGKHRELCSSIVPENTWYSFNCLQGNPQSITWIALQT